MEEVTGEVTVTNKLGIHARPAAALVQRVLTFQSDVFLLMNGNRVNAKSIMGLLTLAATKGTVITVQCKGPDAEAAFNAVKDLFESGFGEQ
jgi:phosphocarrier protein